MADSAELAAQMVAQRRTYSLTRNFAADGTEAYKIPQGRTVLVRASGDFGSGTLKLAEPTNGWGPVRVEIFF